MTLIRNLKRDLSSDIMGNTKRNMRHEYDDDERNFKKKYPKHSPNVKGRGMKTLNSYVEEEDFEDELFKEEILDDTKIRFYTKH